MASQTGEVITMCLHNQLGFNLGPDETLVQPDLRIEKHWTIRFNEEVIVFQRAKNRSKSEMQMVCDFANKVLQDREMLSLARKVISENDTS
jgi:hypothetical protein